jgi:hypothetical protein
MGDSESRQMLEGAIEQGRGGVYLRLTPIFSFSARSGNVRNCLAQAAPICVENA